MFTKGSNQNQPQEPRSPAPPSMLSADLSMTGNLESHGEIQIDGHVQGDIKAENLLVGEKADVRGEIVADTVRVHGRVEGQIRARLVSLAKSAHVVGDILHHELAIEQGAFLEGNCRRIEGDGKKAAEGGAINLLVKGGKGKSEPPPRKEPAETAAE
jgi:cytoskeletal protein CcmA (bactofilin family)